MIKIMIMLSKKIQNHYCYIICIGVLYCRSQSTPSRCQHQIKSFKSSTITTHFQQSLTLRKQNEIIFNFFTPLSLHFVRSPVSTHPCYICCIFQPAFRCCMDPKAGQNTFVGCFQPFLLTLNVFGDFSPEIKKKLLKTVFEATLQSCKRWLTPRGCTSVENGQKNILTSFWVGAAPECWSKYTTYITDGNNEPCYVTFVWV